MSHISRVNESRLTDEWVMSLIERQLELGREDSDTYQCLSHVSHVWMSHVSHVWMSHVSHVWMSHVSRMDASCQDATCHLQKGGWSSGKRIWTRGNVWVMSHTYARTHTYERITSHVWISHVSHMNESCHSQKGGWRSSERIRIRGDIWVMSHTYGQVVSYDWMRHVTHRKAAGARARELGFVEIFETCLTRMNESCLTYDWRYDWDMSLTERRLELGREDSDSWRRLYRRRLLSIATTCDMTHSHVWPDSFLCVT